MMYQAVQTRLLASFATAMALAFAVQSPVQAGTVQDGSWGGTSDYQKMVYDVYARQLGEQYSSVGIVQQDGFNSGSGTLIGNRWVLTSAHLVSNADSLSFKINGKTYQASRWFAHSGYDGTVLGNGRDIALIKLDSPVKGVKPSRVAPRTLANGLEGEEVTTVGYGGGGTGLTGNGVPQSVSRDLAKYSYGTIAWGIERAGRNVIDHNFFEDTTVPSEVKYRNRIFTYDFDSEQIWQQSTGDDSVNIGFWIDDPNDWVNGTGYEDVPVTKEWSPSVGDSGGPTFNESGQIVGVSSWTSAAWYQVNSTWFATTSFYHELSMTGERDGAKIFPESDSPDYEYFYSISGFTNVALHADWIRKVKRLANTVGGGKKLSQISLMGSTTLGGIYFDPPVLPDGVFTPYENLRGISIISTSARYSQPIPEPGAIMLLTAGSLMLLRRRQA